MTDVKGDRSLPPHQQADPDLYVHVSRRTAQGDLDIRGRGRSEAGHAGSVVSPQISVPPAGEKDQIALGEKARQKPLTPPRTCGSWLRLSNISALEGVFHAEGRMGRQAPVPALC